MTSDLGFVSWRELIRFQTTYWVSHFFRNVILLSITFIVHFLHVSYKLTSDIVEMAIKTSPRSLVIWPPNHAFGTHWNALSLREDAARPHLTGRAAREIIDCCALYEGVGAFNKLAVANPSRRTAGRQTTSITQLRIIGPVVCVSVCRAGLDKGCMWEACKSSLLLQRQRLRRV